MTEILPIVAIVLLAVVIVLQIILAFRKPQIDLSPVSQAFQAVEKAQERTERAVRDEIARNREELAYAARQSREELANALKGVGDSMNQQLGTMRETVAGQLKSIQDDNSKQLEEMRKTVDEKLQGTLEKRLGESFKLVSERLEAVYKGLGEMQNLATGVGDLKRVLTNVKTRGTWGEVQLGRMLEDVLTPDQYEMNVATKGDSERVEFAIKLPGRGDVKDEIVWLPIDAKFPVEDYQRLVEAEEQGDAAAMETASRQLEVRIKGCAGDICSKYLSPPKTTDFGILFLPTEGLFAEVVRRPGLAESIQRNQRVVIAGPTTLWSILNSLQMGFRTLAIQQRSSEVWNLLAAVKTEFGKYGEMLAKVKKKLEEAANHVDSVGTRSRAIEKKLRGVESLTVGDAQKVLMLEGVDGDVEENGEEG